MISVLPVAAVIDALIPAAPPTEKSPPTYAFLVTDRPPSVDIDAEASVYPVESVTLSACTRPAKVALPAVTSKPALKSALPSTLRVESKSTAFVTSSVPAISVLPAVIVALMNIQQGWALFYGGTSLLIMVGVAIDTIQQINAYLLNRHYDGLMKTGKTRRVA